MRKFAPLFFLLAFVGTSCKSVKNIFEAKTAHGRYSKKLDKKDIDETPEGRQWMAASKRALEDPQSVDLPYRQLGYFHPNKASALGLQFKANSGERITFTIDKKAAAPFVIFADLFKHDRSVEHLLSADTATNQFSFDAEETGTYFLRLQPKLFHVGEYKLSISVGPSLGFPVSGNKANVGSYWGASRDGGKRSHEGIDIFAPRLTQLVAAADGVVTSVKEGGLGGKVVWIKLNGRNASLYYAHLDKQLVSEGQSVKQGDIIGRVGNTGNAAHTASHLHFGVYVSGAPVNPLPYVNQAIKTAAAVPAKNLAGHLKLVKPQKAYDGSVVVANTLLVPLAANSKGYLAELPDGRIIQTPFTAVKVFAQPLGPAMPSRNIAAK